MKSRQNWVHGVLAGFLCIILSLASCSGQNPVISEAKSVADKANGDFAGIRLALAEMDESINAVYAKASSFDLNPALLDTPEYGAFKTFGNNDFYYKSIQHGAAYYLSPGSPVRAETKREILLMTHMEELLMAAYNKANPELVTVAFLGIDTPDSLAMLYPWEDVVSLLPPGLKLNMFEWFNRGQTSNGAPIWSAEPFADLTTGWVMDVAASVKRDSGAKASVVISMNLDKLAQKYFSAAKSNLLLLSNAGVVVAASPGASKAFGLEGLGSIDVIRKSANNRQPGANSMLASSQNPVVQEMAVHLAKHEGTFSVTDKANTWNFVVNEVPEVKFVLVGFYESKS